MQMLHPVGAAEVPAGGDQLVAAVRDPVPFGHPDPPAPLDPEGKGDLRGPVCPSLEQRVEPVKKRNGGGMAATRKDDLNLLPGHVAAQDQVAPGRPAAFWRHVDGDTDEVGAEEAPILREYGIVCICVTAFG